METLRTFVNRYIAEDGEQFDAFEFKCAVVVTIIMCIGLVLVCL